MEKTKAKGRGKPIDKEHNKRMNKERGITEGNTKCTRGNAA